MTGIAWFAYNIKIRKPFKIRVTLKYISATLRTHQQGPAAGFQWIPRSREVKTYRDSFHTSPFSEIQCDSALCPLH